MPIPPGAQTVAMIGGTVLAAAGLNLGVLALDDPPPEPADTARGVPATALEDPTSHAAEPRPIVETPTSTETTAKATTSITTGRTSMPPISALATAPSTTARPTSSPTDPPPPPVLVQTEYLTYEFTGIATIIVALHDQRRLEFWAAAKEPGWVHRVDDDGPRKVKIKFQRLDDGEEAEFEVKFDGGDLEVKQEH